MRKIQYYLKRNPFSSGKKEKRFIGKIKTRGILYQEDLIDVMLAKNTTVTRQDILIVLDLLRESFTEQIMMGNLVYTDLFRSGLSMKGDFDSHGDVFDRKRHQVCLNLKPSLNLQRLLARKASLELISPPSHAPYLKTVFSFRLKGSSEEFYPGEIIEIRGSYLERKEKDSGVYLMKRGVKDSLIPAEVLRVCGKSILCRLPENLAGGEYWMAVLLGPKKEALGGSYQTPVSILNEGEDEI